MSPGWLSSLNPINAFPEYHGPYAVGTIDVEIPAADLPAPCETPEDAQPTIAFRVFYPCVRPSSKQSNRPVRWIAQPQRPTLAALMRFLGLQDRTASTLSLITQQLYWIKIPAHRNAQLLDPPTSNGRWPVTFFSHGLAGSRNAYSHICGDLASNGMMVVALDHRDGSSPIQYVRATADTDARIVDQVKVSHDQNDEVFEARDKQLRIRLWEMSMAYEALMKIDGGAKVENLDENTSHRRKERVEVLERFRGKLDIHRPGKVSWCGHSFGASTIVQLLKSVYYSNERSRGAGKPLFTPSADAAIRQQITRDSATVLLDLWGLPLLSPSQKFLWDRPLPSHANVLSVLSEGFFKWKKNLDANRHIVTGPSKPRQVKNNAPVPAWAQLRDQSPSEDSGYASQDSDSQTQNLKQRTSGQSSEGPHMFLGSRSASRKQRIQSKSLSSMCVLFYSLSAKLRLRSLERTTRQYWTKEAKLGVGCRSLWKISTRPGTIVR